MLPAVIDNVAQVRVVHDGAERVFPVTEILRDGENLNYFDTVASSAALRSELLTRAAEYIDQIGALNGYTVTRPGNTGNLLISPKAVYGL